ncbi:Ush2A [Lemmus lemmus]
MNFGDGATVYTGLETRYHDFTLAPGVEYCYSVTATNSQESVSSPLVKDQTSPSAPSGLQPPKLQAEDALEILADWDSPVRTNSEIINYTLFIRVLFERETGALCTNTTHSSFDSPSLTVKDLKPFHSYDLQLCQPCPPDSASPCPPSYTEMKYQGPGADLMELQPCTAYMVEVLVPSEAGSTASGGTSFTTRKGMPQYQAPFPVDSNESTVCVNWRNTSLLNGQLKEYMVTDGGQWPGHRLLHAKDCGQKLVTCTTDIGNVKTSLFQYDATTGFDLVLTTPGEKKGAGTKSTEFYSELWFIVVIALLGLILLAIFLSLILQRKIHREPRMRERPPLVPLQKRMTPLSVYPPGETHVGLADTRIPRSGTPLSIRSSRSVSILRIPSQSQISQTYTQGSLHRSVSQLMDLPDKKGLADDSLWETIMGHNSGLYVDEEELMNAIKGFSSVTKEHTTFTDTHL